MAGNAIDDCHCVDANYNGAPFNFGFALPIAGLTSSDYVAIKWEAFGGIEIDGADTDETVDIKIKQGDTYAQRFNKYSKGRLKVYVKVKEDKILEWMSGVCPGSEEEPGLVQFPLPPYFTEFTATIDICKRFNIPDDVTNLQNRIVGPTCITQGDTVTYSVAPWVTLSDPNNAGLDKYRWGYSANLRMSDREEYYSADESSTTFTADQVEGAWLKTTLGVCNFPENGGTQVPLELYLQQTPEEPELMYKNELVSWDDELCLPLSAADKPMSITVNNYDPTLTYKWENLEGWGQVIFENNGILTFTPRDDAREIRLIVESDCGVKIYTLKIVRSFEEGINIIENEREGSTCLSQGDRVRFNVLGANNAMKMSWRVDDESNGWSIVSGDENEARPYIIVGSGPTTIYAEAGCGDVINIPVQVKPEAPIINKANQCLDAGDNTTQITFDFTADANATSYEWEFPVEWSSNAVNNTTTNPTITITTDGETPGTIRVKAIGCDESDWSNSVSVNFNPVKPEIKQDGCLNVGLEGETYFYVTNHKEGQTYTWTIDPAFGEQDFSYSPPTNDPSRIKVNTLGNVGNDFEITAIASNDCGDSPASEIFYVNMTNPYLVDSYQPRPNSSTGQRREIYVESVESGVINVSGFTFAWYLNGSLVTTNNLDYLAISELGGGDMAFPDAFPNGYAEVIITEPSGCKYLVETSWGNSLRSAKIASFKSFNAIEEEVNLVSDIIIAPNPANNIVTVTLPETSRGSALLLGLDGKLIERKLINSSETEFDVSTLPNGSYIISVSQNKKRYSKQIIINH